MKPLVLISYLVGQSYDDLQLILGDVSNATLECADDLELVIEDTFDDVRVFQDVDIDFDPETDFTDETDFSVIIYLNDEIINDNCTAVIEDVLDLIDTPEVRVYVRDRSSSKSVVVDGGGTGGRRGTSKVGTMTVMTFNIDGTVSVGG